MDARWLAFEAQKDYNQDSTDIRDEPGDPADQWTTKAKQSEVKKGLQRAI